MLGTGKQRQQWHPRVCLGPQPTVQPLRRGTQDVHEQVLQPMGASDLCVLSLNYLRHFAVEKASWERMEPERFSVGRDS